MPELILERRLVKKGNAATPQVSTWEDWYVLLHRFLMVSSCGQADSQAGGGVKPG
jgi:hypothetical protein